MKTALQRRTRHCVGIPTALLKPSRMSWLSITGRNMVCRTSLSGRELSTDPAKQRIHGRIGMDTFGVFVHLGGSNPIPFTFVDNCADAIALAGLKPGVDGEVFNVVDDDLPSSRQFLRMYKTGSQPLSGPSTFRTSRVTCFAFSGRNTLPGLKDSCRRPSIAAYG